jgi:cysteine desulfuration protein SufE
MSRGLTYADLTAAEQGQYTTLVSRIQAARTGGDAGSNALPPQAHTRAATAVPTPAPPPSGLRHLWAAGQRVFAYGKRWVARLRRPSRAPTDAAQLAHFIRIQAARRGFETFERASFPHFPAGIDPFPTRVTDERDPAAYAYPDAMHRILTTFREASPTQCLELLVAYADTLPDLPEALQQARDTMEQVDECQVPVFLAAQLHEGTVHYAIDVPRDAPTMRGFAGLLHAGLHGATPAAIAATPDDLCQLLGLQKALGSLRVRGLTALLMRMKRKARDVAL